MDHRSHDQSDCDAGHEIVYSFPTILLPRAKMPKSWQCLQYCVVYLLGTVIIFLFEISPKPKES